MPKIVLTKEEIELSQMLDRAAALRREAERTNAKYRMGYSRQHEAAERIEMRHWLRARGITPVMGDEPNHTEQLMKQVVAAGGDPHVLMNQARAKVDETKTKILKF